MMQLLVVGFAVLAVMVVFNLLLSFALIRRLRVLQELVTKGGGLRDPKLPRPGDAIGPFQVTTPEGERFSEELLKTGVSLVGFFTAGCAPCSALRRELLESPPRLPFMLFVEGSDSEPEARELATALKGLGRVAYTVENDTIYKAFKPAGYPTLIRVEDGTVAASGHQLADVLP